ncbi:MAG: SLBB domain-containing protein, partial [Gemmatimonadetes bacterium]|nr:SLBB domain-containing protein [Gemmatimonadota bacterium]
AALEAEAASGRKGSSRARADLAATRQRLERGDFRVGDRFVLSYRLEKSGVDTVSVRDSLTITVGNMPDLRLAGVLRAELDAHLDKHVAKFLRSYQLRASILTRVAVFGAVGAPGYRYVPPDRPISDLLMAAGGPSPVARLDDMAVRRDGRVLLDGKAIRRAINEGRTLEELDIQSGDELVVPGKRQINWFGVIQTTTFVTSILLASVQFITWYYGQQR